MVGIPSIQSLTGTHSGNGDCAVDWGRTHIWEISSTYLSKYDLLTGLELNAELLTNLGNAEGNRHVGFLPNGDAVLCTGGLHHGGIVTVDGTDLTLIGTFPYPSPNFGEGGFVCLTTGGSTIIVDNGRGNAVIGTLNRTQISSSAVGYLDTVSWPSIPNCQICGAPTGSNFVYMANSDTTSLIFSKLVVVPVSLTTIGTIVPTDVDGTWTTITISGMCLDQTDSTVILFVNGDGAIKNYLVKVNVSSGAIIWAASVPGAALSMNAFQFSDIRHQRVAIFTNGSHTVTIYDTSDGSVSSTYTAGLAGVSIFSSIGGQAYNDTWGAIVLLPQFNNTAGSPTLLNSTPTSFTGWAVLYVDAPAPPPAGSRRFLAMAGPVRDAATPVTTDGIRITEGGDTRITMEADIRITIP